MSDAETIAYLRAVLDARNDEVALLRRLLEDSEARRWELTKDLAARIWESGDQSLVRVVREAE